MDEAPEVPDSGIRAHNLDHSGVGSNRLAGFPECPGRGVPVCPREPSRAELLSAEIPHDPDDDVRQPADSMAEAIGLPAVPDGSPASDDRVIAEDGAAIFQAKATCVES